MYSSIIAKRKKRHFPGALAAFLALVGISGPLAGLQSTAAKTAPKRPNLFLISIDTLRADHLGSYGSQKVRTPNIDRLASEGARFRTVVSEVPLTLPAHTTMLTGLYPFAHGVRDNLGYVLAQRHQTLAEVLKANGYSTGAFVGAFVLDSKWGLDQGFDRYDDNLRPDPGAGAQTDGAGVTSAVERPGGRVADAAIEWLKGQPAKPIFAWIHLFDPHDPYLPPEPFRTQYASDLYSGEVAYSDSVVGRILDELKKSNLYDDSLVIVVGDHGEGLGEHGESTHGFFLYEATLRIPLIVKLPSGLGGTPGSAFDGLVQLVDVAPTVLQAAGISIPSGFQGQGLLSTVLSNRSLSSRTAYSETFYPNEFDWNELKSWRTRDYKYILAPKSELYDLNKDASEEQNLITTQSTLAAQFRSQLEAFEARFLDPKSVQDAQSGMSPEDIEKLRSLGYVGLATAGRKSAPDLSRPDPKDKLADYTIISEAMSKMTQRDYRGAVVVLRKLLSRDPNQLSAHSMLGQCYLEIGDLRSAEDSLRKAVSGDPGRVYPRLDLAKVLFQEKRLDESEKELKQVLVQDPQSFQAHNLLGLIYGDLGRNALAIEHFSQAVKLQEDASAYQMLGLLYTKEKDARGAASALEAAVRLQPENAMARLYLANAYMGLGLKDKATEQYNRALAIDPSLREKLQRNP